MPESKRPLKVFLCHASADKPAVRDLYKRLTIDGMDAWLDAESLIPGQTWQIEIPKAIQDSDVVLVCLSENSVNKEGYVQKEIVFALDKAMEKPEGTIFIIPARLQECKVPNRLSMYHWVDLFEENGYEKLMGAMRLRADKIGATLQIKKNVFQKTSESKSKNIQSMSKRKLTLKSLIGRAALVFLGVTALLTLVFSFWKPLNQNMPTSINGETKAVTESLADSFPSPTLGVVQVSSLAPPQEVTTTSTPKITPTQEITKAPTFSPVEITDNKGVAMMLVPAGTFIMGSENGYSDEKPIHRVDLASYYIDKYEVTNVLYKTCVITRGCTSPYYPYSSTRFDYYENSEYENYPVVNVDWNQAEAFCKWRGSRLPTEAEWEKAARGTDGLTYPWGKEIDCSYANYYGCTGDTAQVGTYENGKSPYGVYDMAGNVWELVYDWYGNNYYETLEDNVSNPQGPSTPSYGYTRILRGGSFMDLSQETRSARRLPSPTAYKTNIGFRCARDVNP